MGNRVGVTGLRLVRSDKEESMLRVSTFRKSYQRLSGMLALALDTIDCKQAVFEGSRSNAGRSS